MVKSDLHITVKPQERFPPSIEKSGIKYHCMGSPIVTTWPVSPCSWCYKIKTVFLECTDKSKTEMSLHDPWNYQNIFQNVNKQGLK